MSATASLNGHELELFRVGDYGPKGKYTSADLQDLAARYPAGDQAALTIGHPASDSEPAFGWVKSVRVAGDKLLGTFGEIPSNIDALVQAGSYKHRSVGLSRGSDGKLRLRHVALLGAVPPAVQGLKPAHFSSDPYQEFAIGEGDNMPTEQELKKTIGESIKEFFSEHLGGKPAAGATDREALAREITESVSAKFSADLATERAARQGAEAKVATLEQEFSAGTAQGRADAAIAKLKGSGYWVPAFDKIGVPQLFSALAGHDEQITFSDKDGKEQKQDLLAAFADAIKAMGKIVPRGSLAAGTQSEGSAPAVSAGGAEVYASSAVFSEQVRAHADEKGISYTEARRHLEAQGKRPMPGESASGAV